jgi:hypothetical protein
MVSTRVMLRGVSRAFAAAGNVTCRRGVVGGVTGFGKR